MVISLQSAGARVCQSVACWYWCATFNMRASPNQSPMSCMPMGRPSLPRPQGMDRPGKVHCHHDLAYTAMYRPLKNISAGTHSVSFNTSPIKVRITSPSPITLCVA